MKNKIPLAASGLTTKILTQDEIRELNKDGLNLDESGNHMYLLSFLVNSEQNNAGDPHPYKIEREFTPRLAKTAISRPWIPDTLPNGLHVRPHENATAEEIIEFQKKQAGGEMVATFHNSQSGNENVIIDVFPEYKERVRQGKIKPFVSPMVGNYTYNDKGEINSGEILHLQSVDWPGYDPTYAKIQGTCEGPISKCMSELKPLAAAGRLCDWRKENCPCSKNFLNTKPALGAVEMSAEQDTNDTGNQTPSPEANVMVGQLAEKVDQLDKRETEMEAKLEGEIQQVDSKVSEVQADVATIKADVAKIAGEKPKEESTDTPPTETSTEKPAGAAASQKFASLEQRQKELEKKQKAFEKEKEDKLKEFETKERNRYATIIVKREILEKDIKIEDRDKRTKELLEMKDPNNPEKLRDLSLLAEQSEKKLMSMFPEENPSQEQPLGSAGFGFDTEYSGMGGGNDEGVDYDAIENSIVEEY